MKYKFSFDKMILNFSFQGEIKVSVILLITLFSLPYLAWEIYWAANVGYGVIKWHTHLALYFYIWLFLMWVLKAINHLFKLTNYTQYQVLITSLSVLFILLELYLYASGTGDTYQEHIKTGYGSLYNSRFETYYRKHKPNERFYLKRPEFSYLRISNSLGYSDIEWPLNKKKGEKRLLCLGDSFTEGMGAPADSSFPAILRKILYQRDTNITVMNGASAGDDPCVNFVNYRDFLAAYNPDVIIQTFSSNDMHTDLATKGGIERYLPNGTVKFTKAPWWEPIYALSYISRLFFKQMGYNELLIKTPLSRPLINKLNHQATECFIKYEQEAKKHNAILLVVLQPYEGELCNKKYDYDMLAVARQVSDSKDIRILDLMPYYLNYFKGKEDSIKNYYWKGDGHHNSKGYSIMAKTVENALDSLNYIATPNE